MNHERFYFEIYSYSFYSVSSSTLATFSCHNHVGIRSNTSRSYSRLCSTSFSGYSGLYYSAHCRSYSSCSVELQRFGQRRSSFYSRSVFANCLVHNGHGCRASSSRKVSSFPNKSHTYYAESYAYLEKLVSAQTKVSIVKASDITHPARTFFPAGRIFARNNMETQHFFVVHILNRFENRFRIVYSATAYNSEFSKFMYRFRDSSKFNPELHSKIDFFERSRRRKPPFFVYNALVSKRNFDLLNFKNSEFNKITTSVCAFISYKHEVLRSIYRHFRFLTFFSLTNLVRESDYLRYKMKYFYFSYNRKLRRNKLFDFIAAGLESSYFFPISSNFYDIRAVNFYKFASIKGIKTHRSLHIRPLF